jgi:hypothetical protein
MQFRQAGVRGVAGLLRMPAASWALGGSQLASAPSRKAGQVRPLRGRPMRVGDFGLTITLAHVVMPKGRIGLPVSGIFVSGCSPRAANGIDPQVCAAQQPTPRCFISRILSLLTSGERRESKSVGEPLSSLHLLTDHTHKVHSTPEESFIISGSLLSPPSERNPRCSDAGVRLHHKDEDGYNSA